MAPPNGETHRQNESGSRRAHVVGNVGQIRVDRFPSVARLQAIHNNGKRLNEDLRQVALAGMFDRKSQFFFGRSELSIDPRSVAACINSIPSVILQVDGIQAVDTKWGAVAVNRQPLVTHPRGDFVGSQQRRQQVTLGVTEPGSMTKHIGCSTCDRIQSMVRAMLDFITDELETPISRREFVGTC